MESGKFKEVWTIAARQGLVLLQKVSLSTHISCRFAGEPVAIAIGYCIE